MSDDINLDDIDMDGLDLDFDSDLDPFDVKDDRKPATKVMDGALGSLRDKDNLAHAAKTIADNSLPPGFKAARGQADKVLSEARSIYDKTAKELKGPMEDLKRAVHNNIDGLSFLPNSIKDKIKSMTKEEKKYGLESQREIDEANISSAANEIFGRQLNLQMATEEKNAKAEGARDKRDQKRFEASSALLGQISNAVTRLAAYTEQIESPYQRKMLELGHRQFFMLRDIAETNRAFSSDAISNLRSISKNTGLPEFVKLRGTESYIQLTRERLMGRLNDTAAQGISKFGSRFASNVKSRVSEFTSQVSEGLSMGADMIDTVGGMAGDDMPGMDAHEMAGENIGSIGMSIASKAAGKRLGAFLAKNPTMSRWSNQLLYLSENAPEALVELSKMGDTERFSMLRELIPGIGGDNESVVHSLAETMTDASLFDEMTRRSIVEIIPGYLSRILKTTTDIATGQDNERLTYSVDKEEFVTIGSEVKSLRKRIYDERNVSRSVSAGFDIIDKIEPEGKLSKEQKNALMRMLVDNANGGQLFSLGNLSKLTDKDVEGGDLFASLIRDTYIGEGKEGRLAEGNLGLSRIYKDMKDGFGNINPELGKLNASGNKEIARRLGIIGKVGEKDMVDHTNKRTMFFEEAMNDPELAARLTGVKGVDLDLGSGEAAKKKGFFKQRRKQQFYNGPTKGFEEEEYGEVLSLKSFMGADGGLKLDISGIQEVANGMPGSLKEEFFEEIENKLGIPVHVLTMPGGSVRMDDGAGPEGSGPEGPLFGMLKGQLDEVNVQLRAIFEATMSSGNTTYSFGAGDLAKFAKEKLGKATGFITGYYSNLGKAFTTAKDTVMGGATSMYEKIKKKTKDFKQLPFDLYIPGKPDPVLIYQKLRDGEYFDAVSGKILTSFNEITGPVVDADGNIVLSFEDLKQGLVDRFGKKIDIEAMKSTISDLFTKAKEGLGNIYGMQFGLAKTALNAVKPLLGQAKKLLSAPMDVYVAGERSPRLLARIMENGGYVDADGKIVSSLRDVKGDIYDLKGNVVLSLDDIRNGIFDKFGVQIKSSELLSRLTMAPKLAIKKAKEMFTMAKNFGLGAMGHAKDLFKSLFSGFGGPEGIAIGGFNSDILERIYRHMEMRWPVQKAALAGDMQTVYKNEAEAKVNLTEAMNNFVAQAKEAKDKFSADSKEKVDKHIKPHLDRLMKEVKNYNPFMDDEVDAEVDVTSKRKVNSASLKDLMATLINKIDGDEVRGDGNGDGLRDGGWRAQLKRRKDQLKEKMNLKPKDRAKAEKDAEKSGDSTGLIAMVLGGISDKITGALGGFSGVLDGLKSLIAGKALGGMLPDGTPDLGKGGKKGLLRRVGGKLGGLAKGAGRLALGAGSTLGRVALTAGAGLGKMALGGLAVAGKGLLAAGAAVISSPVLIAAAVGGLAYGGYKAYKYFSDRSEPEGVEKMRFLQYGVDLTDKSAIANIRQLEAEVMDEISWQGNRPILKKPVKEFAQEFAEDFGVDMNRPEQIQAWAIWFAKRFIPIFLTHLSAAKKMGIGDDIEDIESDIKEDQRQAFIKAAVAPRFYGEHSPLDVSANPWPMSQPTNTESELNSMLSTALSTAPVTAIASKAKADKAEKVGRRRTRNKTKDVAETKLDTKEIKEQDGSKAADVVKATTSVVSSMKAAKPAETTSDKSVVDKGMEAMASNQHLSNETMSRIEMEHNKAFAQRERSIQQQVITNSKLDELIEIMAAGRQRSASATKAKAKSQNVSVPVDLRRSEAS